MSIKNSNVGRLSLSFPLSAVFLPLPFAPSPSAFVSPATLERRFLLPFFSMPMQLHSFQRRPPSRCITEWYLLIGHEDKTTTAWQLITVPASYTSSSAYFSLSLSLFRWFALCLSVCLFLFVSFLLLLAAIPFAPYHHLRVVSLPSTRSPGERIIIRWTASQLAATLWDEPRRSRIRRVSARFIGSLARQLSLPLPLSFSLSLSLSLLATILLSAESLETRFSPHTRGMSFALSRAVPIVGKGHREVHLLLRFFRPKQPVNFYTIWTDLQFHHAKFYLFIECKFLYCCKHGSFHPILIKLHLIVPSEFHQMIVYTYEFIKLLH